MIKRGTIINTTNNNLVEKQSRPIFHFSLPPPPVEVQAVLTLEGASAAAAVCTV